jgi:hypothetical protein
MFFISKGKLRKKYNEILVAALDKVKDQWQMQKNFNENSLDPSEDVIVDYKLTEIKYFILIREAKHRKINFVKR